MTKTTEFDGVRKLRWTEFLHLFVLKKQYDIKQ